MSTHRTPQEIRRGLKHPVIDGDGHWVEYTPVFAEKMRKVVGDLGADGFLKAQRRIPDALRLTPAQRKQRHIGMEGFWTRQSTNTLDPATATLLSIVAIAEPLTISRWCELATSAGVRQTPARAHSRVASMRLSVPFAASFSRSSALHGRGWLEGGW